jgi:hypothetical protein
MADDLVAVETNLDRLAAVLQDHYFNQITKCIAPSQQTWQIIQFGYKFG